MRKIIEKKVYDTETALMVADYWNGMGGNDYANLTEELYVTKKKNYFLFGSGGPLSKYGKSSGNQINGSSEIIPLSKDEAYQWLEEHGETEAIEEFFSDEFKEA